MMACRATTWAFLTITWPALAQAGSPFGELPFRPPAAARYLAAEAVPSDTTVAPGQTFHVALDIRLQEGWHYYSPDPGSAKLAAGGSTADFTPAAASVEVSAGALRAGQVLWPADKPLEYVLAGTRYVNNAYEGRTILYVAITVPPGAPPGPHKLAFHPRGQVCGELCVNLDGANEVTATAEVTVGAESATNPRWAEDPAFAAGLPEAMPASKLAELHRSGAAAGGSGAAAATAALTSGLTIWTGLGLALLAGLILNVMPCVLPVIPIRILSIVDLARESRRRFVTMGLAFAGGIVLFFAALAAASGAVRLAGGALDWGRHFQLAPFRIGMALLMVTLAVNLFGLYTVTATPRVWVSLAAAVNTGVVVAVAFFLGVRGAPWWAIVLWIGVEKTAFVGVARAALRRVRRAAAQPPQGSHLAATGMGCMMAVLATPCSFAILAGAFAWAQTQALWLGSLGIVLIGVGMAAPHAVLTAFPSLVGKLPRPGRWMEHLKQSMGFVMLLVAVWLIGTLCPESPTGWVAAYAVVLAFCLWVWGSWVRYDASRKRKLLVRGLAAALALGAGYAMLRPSAPPAVRLGSFDEAHIAAARRKGQIVVVKFTAAWCLSCRVVDAAIYNDPEVARRFGEYGVLAVKGDVTTRDLPANAMLYERFRGAPPLTVIFPPGDGEPIFLPGEFSRADLFAALDRARR